jgi:hypothetical protein
VPFTSAITQDGLLSWGIDLDIGPNLADRVSWRWWVTRQLAEYLKAGAQAPVQGCTPRDFALQRIRLNGVDPQNWMPTADMRRQVDQVPA